MFKFRTQNNFIALFCKTLMIKYSYLKTGIAAILIALMASCSSTDSTTSSGRPELTRSYCNAISEGDADSNDCLTVASHCVQIINQPTASHYGYCESGGWF